MIFYIIDCFSLRMILGFWYVVFPAALQDRDEPRDRLLSLRMMVIPEILDLEVWYVVDLPAALQDEDMLQSGRQT